MFNTILCHPGTVEDTVSVCEARHCCHPTACGDATPQYAQVVGDDCWRQSILEELEVLFQPQSDMPRRISELPAADFAAYAMLHIVSIECASNGLPSDFLESARLRSLRVDLHA